MLIFQRQLKAYSSSLTLIVSFILGASTLLYNVINLEQGSNALQFLRAWSLAIAQIIIVNQFPRLRFKIIFTILTLLIRYGVTVFLKESTFDIDVLLRNIGCDIFVIYVYYACEEREKALFEKFYNYREELNKYKILIENHLPQSVIVLDAETQRPLFANKAFSKQFEPLLPNSQNERASADDESKPLSSLIDIALSSLAPHIGSLESIGKPLPISSSMLAPRNLKSFLNEIVANDFFEKPSIMLTASGRPQSDQSKSFEIVLMPITWDIQEAVVFVFHDVTDQEKAFGLRVAEQNKNLVMTTMSHELRTPLNGIIGILQLIGSKVSEKKITDLLALCRDNATLLLSLINSILDLQQFHHGRLKLLKTEVHIRKMMKDIAHLFQFQLSQKGLSLNINVSDSVPVYIQTDLNRLKHVLINLLANAVKFTSKGGITLEVVEDTEDSRYIEISVSDTGVGIKQEQMHLLFKMFRKTEDDQSQSKHGVGLGLTISDTLVQALNGNNFLKGIEVESEYGRGSRFWFKLPKNGADDEEFKSIKEESKDEDEEEEEQKEGEKEDFRDFSPLGLKDSHRNISSAMRINSQDGEDINEKSNVEDKVNKYHFKSRDSSILSELSQFATDPQIRDEKDIHRLENSFNFSGIENPIILKPRGMNRSMDSSPMVQRSRGHVLVVDDNSFNLMIAQNFVKILSYTPVTATNGEEALIAAKASFKAGKPIKIILMDCQMPVMDGFEATIKLKEMMERLEIPTAPIIAITANDTEEDRQKCLRSGMSDHIAKPLLVENLARCISKYERK